MDNSINAAIKSSVAAVLATGIILLHKLRAQKLSMSSRKRKAEIDEGAIKELAMQLGEVAKSLRTLTEHKYIFSNKLFEQVMSVDGFEEEALLKAYDYLIKSEVEARAFISRKDHQKKLWLEKFLAP